MKKLFDKSSPNKLSKEWLLKQITDTEFVILGDKKITHCTITVKNTFSFTGESVCVVPENYSKAIGEEIAFDDAFDKMWVCYGFALAQFLYEQET